MKVIGLTGGIGSGKTTVANILRDKYHAYVIFSDEVAKELMEPGQISYRLIVETFGTTVLGADKCLDRQKLALMVFENSEKLALLNSLTHPYVEQFILEEIKRIRETKQYHLVVVESALLFQVNYDKFCDVVWVVVAEEQARRQRLISSRGYSNEKIDAILEKQMTDEEFRKYTTNIIENSGNMKNISNQIQNMLECLE